MSGPQTAQTKATLGASPSNFLESPCRKARSRLRAVLRSGVSTMRDVSACSASRVRSPNGIVARPARHHPAAEDRRRTGRLPAASARVHGALRGGAGKPRDSVWRHRRRGACGAHPPPCPEGTPRLPRLRAFVPRLCPTEMPCVQRNATSGFQLQGTRVLPILHGTANERHGREPDRARAAAFNPASPVGADLPVLVETEACAGRRIARPTHPDLRGYGAGVLCPSSGPRGRHGCEDRRGDRGAEGLIRHAAESPSSHDRAGRRLVRARERAGLCGPWTPEDQRGGRCAGARGPADRAPGCPRRRR